MAPNSPVYSFIHASMAGSRSSVPLNRSNSVLIVAPLSAFEIYGYRAPSHEERISRLFRLVVRRARVCGANLIFTLHEAAVIAARRNVMERDIAWHRAKERNAFSDQHRYARDYQSVDQS